MDLIYLDLHKMLETSGNIIPNGGLLVIYHSIRKKSPKNKSKYMTPQSIRPQRKRMKRMQFVFRKPCSIVAIPVLWWQVEGAFAHIAYAVTVLRLEENRQ